MISITMYRNKTGVFNLSAYEQDGMTPQSLVGGVLWFHAAFGVFAINKYSPNNGITNIVPSGGLNCALLQIEPTDTSSLAGGLIQMPCELTLQLGGEDYELDSGTLTVLQNVGTP